MSAVEWVAAALEPLEPLEPLTVAWLRAAWQGYSPDQERDERGRFGPGGGGVGGTFHAGGNPVTRSIESRTREYGSSPAEWQASLQQSFPNADVTISVDEANPPPGVSMLISDLTIDDVTGICQAADELAMEFPRVAAGISALYIGNDDIAGGGSGVFDHGAIELNIISERNGDEAYATMTHEFGHAVDYTVSGFKPGSATEVFRTDVAIGRSNIAPDHLSTYSQRNSLEYFAEAFTADQCAQEERLSAADRVMLDKAYTSAARARGGTVIFAAAAVGGGRIVDDFRGSIVEEIGDAAEARKPRQSAARLGEFDESSWVREGGKFSQYVGDKAEREAGAVNGFAPVAGDLSATASDWQFYGTAVPGRWAADAILGAGHVGTRITDDFPGVHREVLDAIDGKPAPEWARQDAQTAYDNAQTLLEGVRDAPAVDYPLYRGMGVDQGSRELATLEALKPGDRFDVSLASFSGDPRLAESFEFKGGTAMHPQAETPVRVVLEAGAQGVPGPNTETEVQVAGETEWRPVAADVITGGRMEVVATREIPGPTYPHVTTLPTPTLEITVKQVGVFDPSNP